MNNSIRRTRLGAASVLAIAVSGFAGAVPALAADPAIKPSASAPVTPVTSQQAGQAQVDESTPEVVVTGFRASLENALNIKRTSNQIVDAITAEDIADFPDANLAESIQRLPGVSIDRDNGEGRSITIRGLGGDFQQTRLNGADAQAAAGGNQSDAGANRSRGFDFNTFASELFGGVKITKSTAAVNDEGSLGAIIDLTTGRPLGYKKNRFAVGAEGEYRENGKTWNPRLTALASVKLTDNFGILGSVAYQKQDQQIDSYRRNIGQFEYLYRNSQLNGVTPATYGFARPSTAGTGPTFGSDPAAYALLAPTTIIPALPSIGRQELSYERIGATATAQWRPTSRTEIIIDGVYSRYAQDSETYGITTIGLNRNGTNARAAQTGTAGLRAIGTTNGNADRVALYANCVASATINCAGTEGREGTVLTGFLNSQNPNNLNPFDYYNNPLSRGYIANANQTAFYDELIGRPSTKVRAANVNAAGQTDYLVLDDVDWRSFADAQYGVTEFWQGTVNATQEITDTFRADLTLGYSKSTFRATGLLAEFNAIDRDGYTFDDRGGGKMPIFNPGFDVANPNNWTLVKGLSTIRYFTNTVDNEFKVGRLNFTLDAVPDTLTLRFGGTWKRFAFTSDQRRRSQTIEAINPTLLEAGLAITDLGQTIGFGQGLNVTAGTPTSMYVPSLDAFRNRFGIDCDCVNKWGDYRAVADGRQRNAIIENDLSGFFQADFNFDLFGRPLRGDMGLRVARTRIIGDGAFGGSDGVAGFPVTATNTYYDWLPSTNLVWEPGTGLLVRFAAAKVMARPQLGNLTPGTTSFPSFTGGLNSAGNAPSVTIGNPYLNPFRATNYDLSFEKYFGRAGLVSVTLFRKDIASFPQQIAGEGPLQSILPPEIFDAVVANFTNVAFRDYVLAGGPFNIRQFRDAPGGKIEGVEVNIQSNFVFLPAPFDKFGVIANYTHINSKLSYLTGTGGAALQSGVGNGVAASNSFAEGPFLNTSPDAFNATLYYEDKRFSARVSGAYRKRYVNRFPLAAGTCAVGTTTNGGAACNSPVLADFGYNEDTLNIDFAMSYNVTKWAKLTLEGRNLTNEAQYRTMYEANPVTQSYASTGRIVTGGFRLIF
ncbi:TonB-dependent receptor domain-containing protein [Sphingomonas sp.]|uniref:TonB-dependent receptor domain-containing protein n=1 Tax=Sphingomonas sp. TaxID=28214 RepID=UPI002DD677B7|nr:TonB-dependent receptor [Sphingomonas sp.]